MEVLAAAMLLSLAVVVLAGINARSLSNVSFGKQYEQAWELFNRQMTYIDYIGAADFLDMGQLTGQFGDEDSTESYVWTAECELMDTGDLYQVTLTLSWPADAPRHSISETVYLNSTAGGLRSINDEDTTGSDFGVEGETGGGDESF